VIGGWGSTGQLVENVGTFSIPTTGGYSAYLYVPLRDRFGNYAQVTMGGTNTYRALELTDPGSFGLNINFYMLTAPRTDLPRIDTVYPDGATLLQQTNTLSFVASSPTYGINTTNVHLTLNGVDVSTNLVLSGSPVSWNVSYTNLQAGRTYTAIISITDSNNQTHATTVTFDTFSASSYTWEAEDFDFDPTQSPVPNGSGLRYIDDPAPTSLAETNSYLGQVSALTIDVANIFGLTHPGAYVYRPLDWVATQVTSDSPRQKYLTAQQVNQNPGIRDYIINFLPNTGWVNYTRTYPSGHFYVYARVAAGNGAFTLQCSRVTDGWGTGSQTTQFLGAFTGTGASFNTWQYVQLMDTNTSLPLAVSLGGTNTLQFTADGNEDANFFLLVPAVPIATLTAALSGPDILLSFPTQTGFGYTVSYKNELTDPTWTPLSTVPGNWSVQTVTNATAGQGHRFYRLTIQ
jgi:hypothetical protein